MSPVWLPAEAAPTADCIAALGGACVPTSKSSTVASARRARCAVLSSRYTRNIRSRLPVEERKQRRQVTNARASFNSGNSADARPQAALAPQPERAWDSARGSMRRSWSTASGPQPALSAMRMSKSLASRASVSRAEPARRWSRAEPDRGEGRRKALKACNQPAGLR